MDWQTFREQYTELQLNGLREKSAIDAESRSDIAERIVKPKRRSDMADAETLHDLQAKLLAGAESKRPARSPQTARNYLVAVLAALNWAVYMGWLPAVPPVRKLKVSKRRQMKGRPLTDREFHKMLKCVRLVVGREAAPSWQYTLRALWESGLRLDELMHFHWSDGRIGKGDILVFIKSRMSPFFPPHGRLAISVRQPFNRRSHPVGATQDSQGEAPPAEIRQALD